MNNLPPFLAGQDAYRRGKSIDSNPHPEKHEDGDRYPGDWKNWQDGWNHEKAAAEFEKGKT